VNALLALGELIKALIDLTTVDLGPIIERHNRLAGQLVAMA
jgi:hypothetical protein